MEKLNQKGQIIKHTGKIKFLATAYFDLPQMFNICMVLVDASIWQSRSQTA